jgi:two-component SAPR family response regulator
MKKQIIWLIDDDAFQNKINKRTIQKVCTGCDIQEFTNPLVALVELKEVLLKPDFIFIDIEMPLMTGIDFIQEMRNAKLMVPIVVLSSSLNVQVAQDLLEVPFVAKCVAKPLTPTDLDSLIH